MSRQETGTKVRYGYDVGRWRGRQAKGVGVRSDGESFFWKECHDASSAGEVHDHGGWSCLHLQRQSRWRQSERRGKKMERGTRTG